MSAFWKDIFREIRNTFGRFLSLVIITLLGAASVVGIQAAAIDMRDGADKLYKQHNLYDLQLKSTMGFGDDDISALKDTAGVKDVMPSYVYDVFVMLEEETRAARTYSLPDTLNTIDVTDGRLPENASECTIERSFLRSGDYKIGDSVKLGLDNADDYFDVFAGDTFTIVGVVSSPLYISGHERGNTTLGDGSLSCYFYLHPDAYILDVYTDAYVSMLDSDQMYNLTEEYYAAADEWKNLLKQTGNARVQVKLDELSDAQTEIDDGWAEYYDGVKELDEKTYDARQELADAAVKLTDAKTEIEDGQKTLDEKIADGQKEIAKNKKELDDGFTEIDARLSEIESGKIQIDQARVVLDAGLEQLKAMSPMGVSPELDAQYEQILAALALLDAQQAELDAGRAIIDASLKELENGRAQIKQAEKTLENERAKAQVEIDDGWAEYLSGLEEYNDGLAELETQTADAERKLSDAFQELTDAQEKLDDAPEPEWFLFTRKEGLAYDSYYQDTLRLQKIGYVFPLVFFLVAVMVSLTSMSRMVEEHRTQIGVYKALGYRPAAIMTKYFIYALGASVIGGIAGIFVGSVLFPWIITDAYGYLYDMPPIDMPVPPGIGFIAVAAASASVVSVTLVTCAGAMSGQPALLMRPKAPPIGKRVLMEKISFIWNRLSFIGKVTARNIFRYKKRFLMTLVGIAGCSALLVTAFGLRDSIGSVAELQFGGIVTYDMRAYLKDIETDAHREEIDKMLPDTHMYIREESADAKSANGGLSVSIVVPENPEKLDDFIKLYDPKTNEPVQLEQGGALVTEKLARVMGVTAGGSFTVMMGGGKEYTVKALGIVENYVTNYIYMTRETYIEIFGGEPYPNSVLINSQDQESIAKVLLDGNSDVRAVIRMSEYVKNLQNSTDALGIVTVVLIALACALALVVLFNLTNINISERIRELATIKVLGFYDNELSMYVYRENGAVTAMGIVLGIFGGILLHGFVLNSVEIDLLKFPSIIKVQSYILAAVLSAAFAVFVNLVMNYKLAKIDMVESLKNVE